MNISGMIKDAKISADGEEWHDLVDFAFSPMVSPDEMVVYSTPKTLSGTFHFKADINLSVLSVIVGQMRPYPLREHHLNLSRYCRWPYTN